MVGDDFELHCGVGVRYKGCGEQHDAGSLSKAAAGQAKAQLAAADVVVEVVVVLSTARMRIRRQWEALN